MSESTAENKSAPESGTNADSTGTTELQGARKRATGSKKRLARLIPFVLVVVAVAVGGYFFSSRSSSTDVEKTQGKVALSEQELKNVVAAKHLTVYWAGPQDGAKYALIAATPTIAYVRYLPGGVGLTDTKTFFRVIGTYRMKNAFNVTQTTGTVLGNIGFTNADGNAVFYSSARSTNVYIGVKGKDIQIELFDPGADQALGMATIKGQVRPVA